jgi:EpsI family protein
MRNWRDFVPAAVLILGCGFMWQTHAQRRVVLPMPLRAALPTIPGYRVEDQQISRDEQQVAGMSDYVARLYSRDSIAVFSTLVTYYESQAQGKTIHSPRNCLPGAGWEILRAGTRVIAVGGIDHTVNLYVLKKGPATALAYYWYQGRGRVVASEYRVKWNLLRDAAFVGHTEEALVRIVVPLSVQGGVIDPSGASNEPSYLEANAIGDSVAHQLITDVARVMAGKSTVALSF